MLVTGMPFGFPFPTPRRPFAEAFRMEFRRPAVLEVSRGLELHHRGPRSPGDEARRLAVLAGADVTPSPRESLVPVRRVVALRALRQARRDQLRAERTAAWRRDHVRVGKRWWPRGLVVSLQGEKDPVRVRHILQAYRLRFLEVLGAYTDAA